MKTTVFTLFAFCFSLMLVAQDDAPIVFEYTERELDLSGVELGTKKHSLGEEIAKKEVLFKERYLKKIEGTPTSPTTKTVIVKPVVYNSINKIDKYLVKSVKKGLIEKEQATEDLNACLNVALVCSSSNTIELEKRLKAAKSPDKMIEVYKAVVLEK